jgi:hypothetical protein
MLANKKFVFEVSVEAVPHTEETCKEIYGGGYNPDFPISTHAGMLIGEVLKDAVCGCIRAEMKHLSSCKCEIKDMTETQRDYHRYLKKKTAVAEYVRDSLKFARMEG